MTRWQHELSGQKVLDVEELIELIATHLGVHTSEIAPGARFIEDLRASHTAVAALLVTLEERFELHIPTQDVAQLTTLSAVLLYLDSRHPM